MRSSLNPTRLDNSNLPDYFSCVTALTDDFDSASITDHDADDLLEDTHLFDPEFLSYLSDMNFNEESGEDVLEKDDQDSDEEVVTGEEMLDSITANVSKNMLPDVQDHDTVVTQLGDDNIKSTDFASKGAKIEPALRVYPGSHHMCITNEDLDQGRGNGTLCKFLRVKLREDGRERRWKNWDGKKVWTVSIDDVEWMEFEHYPTPTPTGTKGARTFKLKPQEFTATIKIPATETLDITLGNAKVKQIPVNSNIATTGHKLQGMSKDVLIINNWDYRCANWVYVVLSRVRTLAGLYLMKPLDLERSFNVPQSLIRFEQRLRDNKEKPILEALGYQSQAQA